MNPPGAGGAPIFFLPQLLIVLGLKNQCQISEPYNNSFWEKSNGGRRQKKEKKNVINSGHLVL
jgi:hypothetical protein